MVRLAEVKDTLFFKPLRGRWDNFSPVENNDILR